MMARPIDHVLDKLAYMGPRNRHSFMCICPAHEDNKASLSVTEGDNGIVLINCFAGCDPSKVLKAVGLTMADLHANGNGAAGNGHGPQRSAPKQSAKIFATYDYVDANGDLLYQTVRYEPKDFRQRRPDGKGDWIKNLDGVERIPYALPRLLASELEQWVFVVEGEKDCDRLNTLGLVATTNPMGAGKWQESYNGYLANRRVCILPDNDDPGRAHAQTIVDNLLPVAAKVCIVELSGLPPKGDVSDWLDRGGTAEQLLALADGALSDAPMIDLVNYPTHDAGNAQMVNLLYPGQFAYCSALGWLQHTGTHWQGDHAEFGVNQAITEMLITRRMAAVKAEREDVVKGTVPSEPHKNNIKGMYRDLVVKSLGEFDSDPNVLNCANGVVDLRSGELVAHGPSNRFTYCVQTPYNPLADVTEWIAFLNDTVGDYGEIADWLQMAFGYSVSGLTREECLFYICGPTRSGKGTFTNAALTLLGQPLARGVDFNTFTRAREDGQNFDLASLRTARLISASESGRYASLNEAVVKNITGNDPIIAAYKHRDQFTYTPQFKIWMSSNHPVKGDVDDDAFWGRLRVIRFPNSHLDDEDKGLKWRMSGPNVLPGLLAWAIEGARRWYASRQGLITPVTVRAATKQQRAELDHVQQWLDACTVKREEAIVTMGNLYQSYCDWCADMYTPMATAILGRSLVAKGYEPTLKKDKGKVYRVYKGLILRDSMGGIR